MDNFAQAKEKFAEMMSEETVQSADETGNLIEGTDNNDVVEDTQDIDAQNTDTETMGTEENINPPTTSEQMAGEALSAAEIAVQTAQQKDNELTEVKERLEAISEQNEHLQNTIEQMSAQQAESVVEEMLTPPVLNPEEVLYGDATSQAKALADYQQKYAEYTRNQVRNEIMKELEPVLGYAKEGMAAKERAEALRAVKETVPELSDIDSKAPMLDAIIAQNPFLSMSDKPMEEKYIMAYMLSRGIDAVNNPPAPPKTPTAQELLNYAKNNNEFAELLAKERISSVKNNQQVPPFSASTGAANAAPNIPNKAKNLDEAKEQFKQMFRA